MDRETRSKFVSGYSKALTQTWADEHYRQRLLDDPAAVLAEEGIDVPEGVDINVITEIREEGTLEDQIRLWEEGAKTGRIDLYVPTQPQLDDGELSDTQLEAVAGGGDCCCTCTPCCCCT